MQRTRPTSLPVREAPPLATLLAAAARGNRGAFNAFYDQTVQSMYGLVLRIVQTHDLAEDVISEAYVQAWRQAGAFDSARGVAMAWLSMICRSRALDAVRRRSRLASYETDALHETDDPPATRTPDLLESVERQSALYAALEQLDDDQRQLLALAFFRGHTHAELAVITGQPLGTVKTRIRKGIARLREIMVSMPDPSAGSDHE